MKNICDLRRLLTTLILLLCHQIYCQPAEQQLEFKPTINVRCDRRQLIVSVITDNRFDGVVHVKDYRRNSCASYGNNQYNTTLKINLLATPNDPSYCGVKIKKNSDEQSVDIVVRIHKTLELSGDLFYHIDCGKSRYKNTRNELSRVSLNFLDNNKKTSELVYGHQYTLRASVSNPDSIYGLKVKSCISFASNDTEVQLIDNNGCPKGKFLSEFQYNKTSHSAEAKLYSMFKFPNSNQIHVQCDIVLCRGGCEQVTCPSNYEQLPRALPRNPSNGEDNVQLLVSTSAFVLHPGEQILAQASTECTEWRFPWLIGLCICLAVLLLVMLIVNIFLCSSLTCTCTKTEVVEKEPSEMEDYDPYKLGWAPGSHYGSRTSLNKPGYTSGGSTLNSMSTGSDHYAIVHSRPGSRYSQHSSREPLHVSGGHRGPGSTLSNGQYSSRI